MSIIISVAMITVITIGWNSQPFGNSSKQLISANSIVIRIIIIILIVGRSHGRTNIDHSKAEEEEEEEEEGR